MSYDAEDTPPSEDLQHLRLLSVFHYVVGTLTALVGCFPSIYLAIGLVMLSGGFDDAHGDPPPRAFGWIFVGVASVLMALGWALALAIVVAGRKLARQSGYTYCLVVAALECLLMPWGTILGVFTIVVLVRPSVKQLFEAGSQSGFRRFERP